jgi:hypothetical protein
VAARFGVSVSALRKRAAREGWTKRTFARTQALPPSTAWATGSTTPTTDPALAEAETLPGADHDPLTRPPTEAEAAFVRDLWPIPELQAGTLARKALALADLALRQGRALDARRFAEAARVIADLDDLLPWVEDHFDPDAAAQRGDTMREFIQSSAVRLAVDLHAGRPLGPVHAALAAQFQAEIAAGVAPS